jgi:hypothetical protein
LNCKGSVKDEKVKLGFKEELIQLHGIDTRNSSIDISSIKANQGAKLTLETMDQLFERPYSIPDVFDNFNQSVMNSISNITYIVHLGYRLLGAVSGGFGPPVRGQDDRVPNIKDEDELNQYINDLKNRNVLLDDIKGMRSWQQINMTTKVMVVRILFIMEQNEHLMKSYLMPIRGSERHLLSNGTDTLVNFYEKYFEIWNRRQLYDFKTISVLEELDMTKLSYVSRRIIEQLNQVVGAHEVFLESNFNSCEFETKFGRVGIFGCENHKIKGGYCLTVDLGGNDIYTGSIASAKFNKLPIAILLDYGGDDIYTDGSGFGKLACGSFGISILRDFLGNDRYESNGEGIARTLAGCSILIDENGDDQYSCNGNFSMASSHFGLALLLDKHGNDIYESGSYALGFGGTKGIGLFIDAAGNDTYNSKDPGKSSFIMGSAKGRWAEATDGMSLGGGYGVFIDVNGNDIYNSNSFSQGAAYFLSMGSFYDGGGDDEFNVLSHSQGYAAHFGLANFQDLKGNDTYNKHSGLEQVTQIMGSGRDLSAGFFRDDQGNDVYYFGNRSVGVGDMNGIGFFMDAHGDDIYYWIKNKINKNSGSMGVREGVASNQHMTSRIFENQTISSGYYIDENGNDKLNFQLID